MYGESVGESVGKSVGETVGSRLFAKIAQNDPKYYKSKSYEKFSQPQSLHKAKRNAINITR